MSGGDDFFNSKPEFGVEFDDLQNDPQQAFVEIRKAIKSNLMTPKGALTVIQDATVIKEDINTQGENEYFHVEVHNAHQNLKNPDRRLSSNTLSSLTQEIKSNLKDILIYHDFNSGPAYAYNPSKVKLSPGQKVKVRINLQSGGTADAVEIISVAGTAPPNNTATGGSSTSSGSTSSTQSSTANPVKRKASVSSQNRTKAFKNLKKIKGKCFEKSVYNGSPTRIYINWAGEIIWFDYNCCKKEIKTVQAVYQKKANNSSLKKTSLWKDKKFEQTIKVLLEKEIANYKHPFAWGGKGQYSPPDIAGDLYNTLELKFQKYKLEKLRRQGKYEQKYFDPNSPFYHYFFDCSGFVTWLAIRMGFIFGVRNIPNNSKPVKSYKNSRLSKNKKYKKANYNVAMGAWPQAYQSGYPKGGGIGIEISLEQFVATPGAIMAFRYGKGSLSKFSHIGISQGTGSIRQIKVDVKGRMVDGVEVDIYETLNWKVGQKRTRKFYKKGKFYIEISNNRTMHFGLPLSFMLADYFGYWTGPDGENDPTKGKKKP